MSSLLIAACEPGEDGGSGDGGNGRADAEGQDLGGDGGGNVGQGIECLFSDIAEIPACESCLVDLCGDPLQNAFGVRGIPQQPGGTCSTVLSCVESCRCDDAACIEDCQEQSSQACNTDLSAVGECSGNCLDACSDVPTPTEDCGNDVIDEGEDCDGFDIAIDCTDLDFEGGTLACTELCTFDTTGCTRDTSGAVCDATPIATIDGPAPFAQTSTLDAADDFGGPRSAPYEVYELQLDAGSTVTITHTAPELDSYLALFDAACTQLAADDDSAGDLDSQIIYTAETSGTYYIVATAFSGSESGTYTLDVVFDAEI